jgi:hypothetical protein
MPRTRKTVDTQRVQLAKDEREALQLKIGGASYARIGEHQGVNGSTAYRRVQNGLAGITLAPATELKMIEDQRLDALIAASWPVAMKQGARQIEAVREVRRLSESRRKLHGLDAPSRRAVEVLTEDGFAAVIAHLEADLALNDA